jgi:acetyl-CoA carboxylase biotin carboxyl carrier protein
MDIKQIQELGKAHQQNQYRRDYHRRRRGKDHRQTKERSRTAYSSTNGSAAPVYSAPPTTAAPSTTTAAPPPAPAAEAPKADNLITIKSPMIGTFYRQAGPGKPVFANVGDEVTEGKVVCIIEAMKLFNEIESEVKGKIVKVLVEDASPVEYDQPLFL